MAPRILTLPQLRKIQPPSLLADTHLVSRGLNIIFGPSGMYKSFYALDQALRIARTLPVVYVAAEGSTGFMRRIDAWCEYHKEKLPDEFLWFIPEEINLLKVEVVTETIKTIQARTKTAALVVLDTYARCLLGGDENSARDTGIAVNSCAQIQRALDSAVTLVHHSNKAGISERGSGALRGGADLMIEMGAEGGVVEVACSKSKDSAPWPAEYFRFYSLGDSGVLEPCEENSPGHISENLSERETKILKFLTLSVFEESGATAMQIETSLNIPHKSIFRLLSSLKTRSVIIQGKKGDPYHLSDTGKMVLQCQAKGKATQGVKSSVIEISGDLVS